MSLTYGIQAFINNTVKANANTLVTEVTRSTLQAVVRRTPVDTGHLKSNWNATVDAPSVPENNNYESVATSLIVDAAMERMPSTPAGHVVYIANPTPYGPDLESGATPSRKMQPGGMVGLAAVEFEMRVKEAARLLK